MAGTAARERGSCHLYGSLPTPSYSMLDLACCAALVNASVARVSRAHGQSQASARCSLLASFPRRTHPPNAVDCLQDCACESEMVGTEGRHRRHHVRAGLVQRLFLVGKPSHSSACLLVATLPAAFLVYVRHYVRYLYEPCANCEFPLSRLPYLKNRMAAIVISTAVPRYWVSSHRNTYEKVPLRAR